MLKWIWLAIFLVSSGFSIAFALDDSGSSLADLFYYLMIVVAVIFGIVTFFSWRKVYKATRTTPALVFLTLPVVAVAVFAVCSFITYRKVNKPYILLATISGEGSTHYFYFRTDSSLKIVGHFMVDRPQTFLVYHMRGDTILVDKTLPDWKLVARKYVFGMSDDSRQQLLIPVDQDGKQLTWMSLHVMERKYR